ncbi:MAG: acyl-CoA dehydrogenase family protein [Proteobacteria bacterium]|nr:acyl-CoA dehydrogenase family protein [Pseudomonadota bacterium]
MSPLPTPPAAAPRPFDEAAFRAEVRAFVAAELSPATRRKVENGLYLAKHDYVDWQRALWRRGWFGASWPGAAGGRDWSLRQEHAFLQECALGAAPMIIPYGVNMVGPVLYTFGTAEQQRRWLPDILSSQTWWCQGYSEPGAGSDLASLSTAAVKDGDHYVVNGSKLWTTEAHWADMMHALVRTERGTRKQQGITFLLIDMKTPGITVEPIVTLDGVHHTNQVFFDHVRVPAANVVGAEGDGWRIAKFLLSRERTFIADTGNKLRMMRQIRATVAAARASQAPAQDALMADALEELQARLTALVELEHFYLDEWSSGRDDGIGASVLKVAGSELLQAMSEFWRDAHGVHAACYDPADRVAGDGLAAAEPWRQAAAINYQYLYGRCWTVFGGTSEVQRNIIAAQLLRA